MKKAEDHPLILSYLPDEPTTHVTKSYLFTVVNTMDPAFFAGAVQELENRKLASKRQPTVAPVIEIDSNMVDQIQKFTHCTVGEKPN